MGAGSFIDTIAVRLSRYLTQEADVSYYGSSMAVMNGEDGTWILRETHNASDLFKLRNNTDNSSAVTCKKHRQAWTCKPVYLKIDCTYK
jgi:hypothetical protein